MFKKPNFASLRSEPQRAMRKAFETLSGRELHTMMILANAFRIYDERRDDENVKLSEFYDGTHTKRSHILSDFSRLEKKHFIRLKFDAKMMAKNETKNDAAFFPRPEFTKLGEEFIKEMMTKVLGVTIKPNDLE